MSNIPDSLQFACEAIDATGQAVELRASFQDEEKAKSFVAGNPIPSGYKQWRIRDCGVEQ
jgi:hypothetical protein